jgi:hypothetical protein
MKDQMKNRDLSGAPSADPKTREEGRPLTKEESQPLGFKAIQPAEKSEE